MAIPKNSHDLKILISNENTETLSHELSSPEKHHAFIKLVRDNLALFDSRPNMVPKIVSILRAENLDIDELKPLVTYLNTHGCAPQVQVSLYNQLLVDAIKNARDDLAAYLLKQVAEVYLKHFKKEQACLSESCLELLEERGRLDGLPFLCVIQLIEHDQIEDYLSSQIDFQDLNLAAIQRWEKLKELSEKERTEVLAYESSFFSALTKIDHDLKQIQKTLQNPEIQLDPKRHALLQNWVEKKVREKEKIGERFLKLLDQCPLKKEQLKQHQCPLMLNLIQTPVYFILKDGSISSRAYEAAEEYPNRVSCLTVDPKTKKPIKETIPADPSYQKRLAKLRNQFPND